MEDGAHIPQHPMIGTKVIKIRKMVETFGEQYATSQAKESVWEGELQRNIV